MLKSRTLFISPITYNQRVFYSSELSKIRIQQAYAVLGLDEEASVEDIKKRFGQLAKRYHPDTGGENVCL